MMMKIVPLSKHRRGVLLEQINLFYMYETGDDDDAMVRYRSQRINAYTFFFFFLNVEALRFE